MKLVTQEEPMGCGIACVACVLGKSYQETKKLFENSELSSSRGFYCIELVKALLKEKLTYTYKKFNRNNEAKLRENGVIVFIERSNAYPLGHYLTKTEKGWMNPWINFPCIAPAKAGLQRKLPGTPQWVIYPLKQ